jgi:hypothetical protein
MKRLLTLVAVIEAATGVALLTVPSFVGQLLFGAELAGMALTIARMTGIALISLGIACWPSNAVQRALYGMLTYNTLVTLYLLYVAIGVKSVGPLLWPAVVLHAVLTLLLVRVWGNTRKD